MKRLFKRFVGSLFLLLLALFIFQRWILSGRKPVKADFLYTQPTVFAMDYQSTADALASRGMETSVAVTDNWEADAKRALVNGADLLVLGIDTPPQDNSLLEQAKTSDSSLFFVGAYPGDAYLSQYDKAYYVGSRSSFAGELAGRQMADAFSSGVIPDANQNLLLDYLVASDECDLPLFQQSLIECEHYGIYLQNCLSQIDADSSDPLTESAAPNWSECAVQPEVMLCSSFSSLQSAIEWADEKGWQDITYVSFVNSMEQAAQAQQLGCHITVYYDAESISSTVSSLIIHLVHQESITEGLFFAPDEYGAIWIPYQLLGSAAAQPNATSNTATQQDTADTNAA